MTIEDHAAAISDAIKAAAADGYWLDDPEGSFIRKLDLNAVDEHGDPVTWVSMPMPD